jgi:hypothetical protein
MPSAQDSASLALPQDKWGTIFITVHPDAVSKAALKAINVVIAFGPQAGDILQQVSQIIEAPLPGSIPKFSVENEILIWRRAPQNAIIQMTPDKPKQHHKRHTRKYAEGNLDDEKCFYFRGPKGAMHLKAHNLIIFLQMADGVDDVTWMYHLRKKDYSEWFRCYIKDNKLADAAAEIESDNSLSPYQSRQAISRIVQELYTAPASAKD